MTFDIIIKDAALPDGRRNLDIAISAGRIAAIGPGIAAEAGEIVPADGQLVSPPFVDPHFHMDATLSLGQPRLNVSGTLLEGIALWGELKPLLTHEALVERALRYCDLAVAQGLLAVRSHVDVSDSRLLTVEALLDVRERVASYIDLQLVAFPQDGYFRAPGAAKALERAQHVTGKAVPCQLFLMVPHLVSILALLLVARRAQLPQALLQPYRRGERS